MSYRLQQRLTEVLGTNTGDTGSQRTGHDEKLADHLYYGHGAITGAERQLATPDKLRRKHIEEHRYSSLNTPNHFAMAPELHRQQATAASTRQPESPSPGEKCPAGGHHEWDYIAGEDEDGSFGHLECRKCNETREE